MIILLKTAIITIFIFIFSSIFEMVVVNILNMINYGMPIRSNKVIKILNNELNDPNSAGIEILGDAIHFHQRDGFYIKRKIIIRKHERGLFEYTIKIYNYTGQFYLAASHEIIKKKKGAILRKTNAAKLIKSIYDEGEFNKSMYREVILNKIIK